MDFKSLAPHMRAFALIGHFLQNWSILESSLNRVIEAGLGLETLSAVIATRNIQLRDKIYIASTIVSITYLKDKEKYEACLKKIQKMVAWRNLVAHELFMADEKGDGVEFLVTKAKGKLEFPKTRWSVSDFIDKGKNIQAHAETLSELSKALKARKRYNRLIEALSKQPSPSEEAQPLNYLSKLR